MSDKALVKATANLPAELQEEMRRDLQKDLQDGGFTFPIITYDGPVFQIPGIDKPVSEFRGIYIGSKRSNALWPPDGDGEEKSVPICVSQDAVHGSKARETVDGEAVYGDCQSCFYNTFGSKGNGKRCSNKAHSMIWLTEGGAIVPYLLTIPPTGLHTLPDRPLGVPKIESFIRGQMGAHGSPQLGLLVEFSLEKMTSGPNRTWYVPRVKVVGSLADGAVTPDDYRTARVYAKQFMDVLEQTDTVLVDAEPQTGSVEDGMEEWPEGYEEVIQ